MGVVHGCGSWVWFMGVVHGCGSWVWFMGVCASHADEMKNGGTAKKRRKSYFDFTSDLFFHICTKMLTVLIHI